MKKISLKFILPVTGLIFTLFAAAAFGGDADHHTIELKNGNRITGEVLTGTFTVTSPYSIVTLERDKISEIDIMPEGVNHDIITLNEGGLVEGTIDEDSISIKTAGGEAVTLKKEECRKIILKPM
ncbi:MAG: hypothetical protein GX846_10025 [Deltaproteobacteria bacterium]|nr:hypothetical protein [Deltaproteobacteria bacterium]